MPADWLRPDWPAPPHVRAVFTTRTGGVSQAPFDGMNLGDHVGDAPEAVACNRERLCAAIEAEPVFLQQVHGVAVAELDRASQAPQAQVVRVADACLSAEVGQACTIMVADCLPLLFTDTQGRWVGAAHAGWRGLAGQGGVGVIESVLAALRRRAAEEGSADATWLVWLGPCIGPAAFEVGAEVRAAFVATQPESAALFAPQANGKHLADLAGLARQRLRAAGVSSIWGNDGTPGWCTVSQPSRFFSHRRDAGRLGSTGRMAACIWIG